jgi:prepilin-type N-terminal cleavage/methylation domain-containing protein
MNRKKSSKQNGFTLVELVVVMGITSFLLAITITGFQSSRNKFSLLMERVHIMEALLRARNLTIQTFIPRGEQLCGWGLHVSYDTVGPDVRRYFIYKDKLDVSELDCKDPIHDFQFNAGVDEIFQDFRLPGNLDFNNRLPDGSLNPEALDDIINIPPDPKVILFPDPDPAELRAESSITIQTQDDTPEVIIIYVGKQGVVSLIPRQV